MPPQVIYTEPTDEIVDLVDRVRTAAQSDVALVLSPGTTGFQTPLNVRLLNQLGTRAGKKVSVISGDPHIQELSRVGGLPTFASVPAFERGIQTVRAHADDGYGAGAGALGPGAGMAFATAVATRPAAPPAPPGRTTGVTAGAPPPASRRALYFAAVGVVVLGLLLFLVVAPSAKVTVTLAGTPLTVNPTIQGSPQASNAGQQDHIVTTQVTSHQATQFTATPTGSQTLPATTATATLVFTTDLPNTVEFTVPKGTEFDTQDAQPVRFLATQTTTVCIGSGSSPPANCSPGTSPNSSVPVADATAEARGNVAANTITKWPTNPCPPPPAAGCSSNDLTETNPAPATGGADAKTQVVASQSDVNSWTTQATQSQQTLTNQVNQDLQTKAAGLTIAKDPGGNGSSVTCSVTPAIPAVNTVFTATQVSVACDGKAAAYNPSDVSKVVRADLQARVAQGDTLATEAINCTKPSVTQAADDGTVVLSIQCTSYSKPSVDLTALKKQVTGKSPGDAKNLIEHQFNHVQNVTVSQSPIPFFWLPFFSSRIEIDEAFTQVGQ